jgi:antitoxin component of RelBE/YafQ-DinJ toxin-antitoxin module
MTIQDLKTVATKIDAETLAQIERVASETGLKTAELLRIGIRRLVAEYSEKGKIELGKEAV